MFLLGNVMKDRFWGLQDYVFSCIVPCIFSSDNPNLKIPLHEMPPQTTPILRQLTCSDDLIKIRSKCKSEAEVILEEREKLIVGIRREGSFRKRITKGRALLMGRLFCKLFYACLHMFIAHMAALPPSLRLRKKEKNPVFVHVHILVFIWVTHLEPRSRNA